MSRGVSSFEGPRWAFGTLILTKTCTLQVYDVPPFRFSLSPPTLVLAHQLWSLISKHSQRGAPIKLILGECMRMCAVGERIQLLTDLTDTWMSTHVSL